MTAKEQALYAIMESRGYSFGTIQTVIYIAGQSAEALDDMIVFIEDESPTEQELVERLAGMCE